MEQCSENTFITAGVHTTSRAESMDAIKCCVDAKSEPLVIIKFNEDLKNRLFRKSAMKVFRGIEIQLLK